MPIQNSLTCTPPSFCGDEMSELMHDDQHTEGEDCQNDLQQSVAPFGQPSTISRAALPPQTSSSVMSFLYGMVSSAYATRSAMYGKTDLIVTKTDRLRPHLHR